MTETPKDSDLASDQSKDVTVEQSTEDVSVPVDQRVDRSQQVGGTTAVGKEDTTDTTSQP
jgi:hypothetical protein